MLHLAPSLHHCCHGCRGCNVQLGALCDESSGGGGSVGVAADERAVDGMCVSCRDARAVYVPTLMLLHICTQLLFVSEQRVL